MYSTVPPPQQDTSGIESDSDKEKQGPPRGISEEKWQVCLMRVSSLIQSVNNRPGNVVNVDRTH